MAFGNRQWLRVHHTKPSTLGWSVVVGLYKLMTQPPCLNKHSVALKLEERERERGGGGD